MQIQTLNILDITAGRAASDTSGELHKRSLPSAGLLVGRNMEQRTILNQIHTAPASSPARVIILGGGGMGKSTLALSIVNHPSIVEKFGEHRFFASCESAISASGLISDLASHFGISGDQLQKRLLAALRSTKLLIVLDNFETPWEVLSQRAATERFLGELSSLTNVTLLLTMRGCERPLGTSWTIPTLEPLGPLGLEASRQIFCTSTNLTGDGEEVTQFLKLLDGIPLAVALAANMACTEPLADILQRWKEKGTNILQVERSGAGAVTRLSSLDVSIKLSVESTRISNTPGAFELLQLLALLPNGLPENYSHPSFKSIRRSASALKSAMLAYADECGRLRSLSPIRLYILRHHPPSYSLIAPLEREYQDFTAIIHKLGTSHTKELLSQLTAEWANVESVCGYCLDNFREAEWAISVVTKFESVLFFAGMPESPHLARALDNPVASSCQQVAVTLRQIRRARTKAEEVDLAHKALDLAQTTGDDNLIAEAEYLLGAAISAVDAVGVLHRALTRYERMGDQFLMQQGSCWIFLGIRALMTDNLSQGLEYSWKAVACFEAVDHITGIISAQINMSNIYIRQGSVRKAEAIIRECLRYCLTVGSAAPLRRVYESLTSILMTRGRLTEALRMNEICCQFNNRYGSATTVAFQMATRADILVDMGCIIAARTVFNAAGKLKSNCSPWQQLVRNLREAMLARVERNFGGVATLAATGLQMARRLNSTEVEVNLNSILIEAALDQAQEARDTGSNTMHAFATAALHRTILSLALCSRNQNMNTLVTCIVLLGRSLAAMRLDSDARAVLTWGAEWAARADFMLESAKALVALARLTSETTAVTDKIHEAWKLALDAARGADMGALVAECESQLT